MKPILKFFKFNSSGWRRFRRSQNTAVRPRSPAEARAKRDVLGLLGLVLLQRQAGLRCGRSGGRQRGGRRVILVDNPSGQQAAVGGRKSAGWR